MKWFRNWFDGLVYSAWARANSPIQSDTEAKYAIKPSRRGFNQFTGSSPQAGDNIHSRGVTFQIYSATGGTVLELRDYDPATDRHYNALHVIPAEQDLGQAIGHIITLEALKR